MIPDPKVCHHCGEVITADIPHGDQRGCIANLRRMCRGKDDRIAELEEFRENDAITFAKQNNEERRRIAELEADLKTAEDVVVATRHLAHERIEEPKKRIAELEAALEDEKKKT